MPQAKKKPRPDRERMLAAAEQLFADKGFGATSLRDLLAACECSTTAFYARFESKEDVFAELIESMVRELTTKAFERFARVRSVAEGYDAGIDTLVEIFTPRKGLLRLALAEGAACPPVREALHRSYQAMARLLASQFELLGVPDAEERGWGLVGVVNIGVLRWAVFEEVADKDLGKTIRALARAEMRGELK